MEERKTMTKFIELTTQDDADILINVEAIQYAYPTSDGKETCICLGNNTFQVKEAYNFVLNRIGRATWVGTAEGIIAR